MSLVRRFRVGFALMAAAALLTAGAGTANANPTAPTIPVTDSEATVSTQTLDGRVGVSNANTVRGGGASNSNSNSNSATNSTGDSQVLSNVLAQTGSSTGLLVISGVILLVIGGSLVGSRRVYGD